MTQLPNPTMQELTPEEAAERREYIKNLPPPDMCIFDEAELADCCRAKMAEFRDEWLQGEPEAGAYRCTCETCGSPADFFVPMLANQVPPGTQHSRPVSGD